MRKSTTSLRCVTVGVIATALMTSASPAEADPPVLRVLDHNACGNSCGNEFNEQRVTDAIVASIRSSNPPLDYVTLQEMCQAQVEDLTRRDLGLGWRFLPTGPNCDNPAMGKYGLAVGFRGQFHAEQKYDLPNNHLEGDPKHPEKPPKLPEPRKMLCVSAKNTNAIACSVHIHVHSGPTQSEQVEHVRKAVLEKVGDNDPLFARGRAIVAGDFNSRPDAVAMTPMYQGMHREAFGITNRDNSPHTHTSKRRVDYLWLTDVRGADAVSGRITDAPHSDHKILRATIGSS